jgi:hypothetical protein
VIIRLRSAPVAGVVALLFVLTIAGLAAANTILNPTIVNKTPTTTSTSPLTTTSNTTPTTPFVDTNGNGIADTCEQNVVADPTKAAAEQAAVDLDHDGTISVSEAARSGRTGGKNCNHGGYVNSVANGADEQSETTDEAAPTTDCVPVPLPVRDPSLDGQKNAHGKWISTVAQSDATGGKNCNHGGAVSDASKADNAARKALRDAARAAAKAARQHRQDESGTD